MTANSVVKIDSMAWKGWTTNPTPEVTAAQTWEDFCRRWGSVYDEDAATGMVHSVVRFAHPVGVFLPRPHVYDQEAVISQNAQVVDFCLTQAGRDVFAPPVAKMARQVLVTRILNQRLPLIEELIPTHEAVLERLGNPLERRDLIPYAEQMAKYLTTINMLCECASLGQGGWAGKVEQLYRLGNLAIKAMLEWGFANRILVTPDGERREALKAILRGFRGRKEFVRPMGYDAVAYIGKLEQLLAKNANILDQREADQLIDAMAYRLLVYLTMGKSL